MHGGCPWKWTPGYFELKTFRYRYGYRLVYLLSFVVELQNYFSKGRYVSTYEGKMWEKQIILKSWCRKRIDKFLLFSKVLVLRWFIRSFHNWKSCTYLEQQQQQKSRVFVDLWVVEIATDNMAALLAVMGTFLRAFLSFGQRSVYANKSRESNFVPRFSLVKWKGGGD